MNQVLRQFENAIRISEWSAEAKGLLRRPKGVLACDTETSGLLFHRPSYLKDEERWVDNPFPFGLSLAFNEMGRIVLVWGRYGTRLYDRIREIWAGPNVKFWHNMKYDLRVCKTNGIEVGGPQHCTLTMSRIYWDRRKDHSLQKLAEMFVPQVSDWEEELKGELTGLKTRWTRELNEEENVFENGVPNDEFVNYSFLPDEMIGRYAQTDAFVTYCLAKKLMPEMSRDFTELYTRERKVVNVCIRIEETGMGFDAARGRAEIEKNQPKIDMACHAVEKEAEKYYKPVREAAEEEYEKIKAEWVLKDYPHQDHLKRLRKEKKLHWAFGPEKILDMLLKLGVKKAQLTDRGRVTTEEDVLHRCLNQGVPARAARWIENLMDYRALSKIQNTYLKPLTEMAERTGGTVYTTINPTDTRTGRPASRDPNLLNIPKPIVKKKEEGNPVRACFVPREGKVIYYFDVSQQEMAMLLLYVEEWDMLDEYMKGADIHQAMADKLGKDRDSTKNKNFGVVYGLGIRAMAMMWRMTEQQAKEEMRQYEEAFPFIPEFTKRCESDLKQWGYVQDFFGRRYHVPYQQAYKAVNALVQGGCAQGFKIGLLNVDQFLDKNYIASKVLLPVYDEIQIERPLVDGVEEIYFCNDIVISMTDVSQLVDRGLTLRVDVEKSETNWAEKIEVAI